jgi:hypothetical protein
MLGPALKPCGAGWKTDVEVFVVVEVTVFGAETEVAGEVEVLVIGVVRVVGVVDVAGLLVDVLVEVDVLDDTGVVEVAGLVVVVLEGVEVLEDAGLVVVVLEDVEVGGTTITLLVGVVVFTGAVRWMRNWACAGPVRSKPPIDSAETVRVKKVFRCIGVSFLRLVSYCQRILPLD